MSDPNLRRMGRRFTRD